MIAGRMHAHELDIDVPLIPRLLAARFPRWAGLPLEPVASAGTVNVLYRLGDDMAVRLPRIEGSVGDVGKEHRWLPRLAPLLPVAIPTVLGKGAPADGYPGPWSVYRWLDGEHPDPGRVAAPGLLAEDLARFVAALRRIDPADGPPAYRGASLATQDAATRAALQNLRGLVDTDAATAAWDAALAAPEWPGPPVWIHSDLMPGNLLVNHGRLSAVIDFGTAGVGDPACDLIVAWYLLPPAGRDAFRAALDADDVTWTRGRGRALSMALIQLPGVARAPRRGVRRPRNSAPGSRQARRGAQRRLPSTRRLPTQRPHRSRPADAAAHRPTRTARSGSGPVTHGPGTAGRDNAVPGVL